LVEVPSSSPSVKVSTSVRQNPAASADTDTDYLLDADLAALGEIRSTYLRMVAGIRQEYAHHEETDWRRGRAQFLARFLEREWIYATEYFRARYEKNARANMACEHAMLTQN
jgi:predicted metal-dependent HD superfamily phosphohydrolase